MPIRTDLSTDREPVEVLAEDFVERQRAGEKPTIAEYQKAYPELADEIAIVFPAVLTLHQVDPHVSELHSGFNSDNDLAPNERDVEHQRIGDYRILREIGRGGMGVVYAAQQESLNRQVALKLLPERIAASGSRKARFAREARAVAKLHHTNIVPVYNVGTDDELLYYTMQYIRGDSLDNVIGVLRDGATTVVDHRAATVVPGQRGVAAADTNAAGIAQSLCGPKLSRMESSVSVDANLSAAQKETASLRLTDTHAGRRAQRREIDPFYLNAARIGAQAADAIQYAHDEGILHRDIKPGNLLMDERGHVWLTDFGLARLDEEEGLTESGDIIGTLRYMAPEVFNGVNDVRIDVYSLGLTLYELVCLEPAFRENERHQLIRKVMAGDTIPVRKRRPEVPADLATIIEKATATSPDSRYQTAGELRDDLRRFLEDQPILARQLSTVEKLQRWKRREPTLAMAVGTTILATLIGILGISYNWLEAADARDHAIIAQDAERQEKEKAQAAQIAEQKQRVKAEKAKLAEMEARKEAEEARDEQARLREEAELKAYTTRMALAQVSWENDDIRHTLDLLESAKPAEGEVDRREWEWYYLNRLCHAELWSARGHSGTQTAWTVDVSSDGRKLASGGGGNLYYRTTDEQLPGEVILRDFESGEELGRLLGHQNQVKYVQFRPASQQLVSVDHDGVARLWDTDTLQEVATLPAESGPYAAPQFSPEGSRLLVVNERGEVCVFDVDDLADPILLSNPKTPIHSAAFSPDGQRVVTIGASQESDADSAAFAPVIWSVETGKPDSTLEPPRNFSVRIGPSPNLIRWTPDGQRIVAGLKGGAVSIWDVDSAKWERSLQLDETRGINGLEISPDGRFAVCGTDVSTVFVVDVVLGVVAREHKGHDSSIRQAVFGPQAARIASVDVEGTVKVWDNTRPQSHLNVKSNVLGVELSFSPDSRRIYTLDSFARGSFDVLTGIETMDPPMTSPRHLSLLDIQFPRADGVIHAADGWMGMPVESWYEIVRIGDGRQVARINLKTEAVTSAALDPTGRLLALVTRRYHEFGSQPAQTPDNRLRLYDARTFEPLGIVTLPNELRDSVFGCRDCRMNADGSLLAAAFNGIRKTSEIIVVDTSQRQVVDRIVVEPTERADGTIAPILTELDFHPTLPHLGVLNPASGELSSWILSRTKGQPSTISHTLHFRVPTIKSAFSMAYSPVGHRIAVANQQGRVQLFDARNGSDVLVLHNQKKRTTAGTNLRIRFSPDGQSLACFRYGGLTIWSTCCSSPEARHHAWQARLPEWRQSMLRQVVVGGHDFDSSFYLDQLVRDLPEGVSQKAARHWHQSLGYLSGGGQRAIAAQHLALAFDAHGDWRLAAKAARLFAVTRQFDKARTYTARAAEAYSADSETTPVGDFLSLSNSQRLEHLVAATYVADCLQKEKPELAADFMARNFKHLDPDRPIDAAIASLAVYAPPEEATFNWDQAFKSVQACGIYPGVDRFELRRQPRTVFHALLARLQILSDQPEDSLPGLDLIIEGDPIHEARVFRQFATVDRRHFRDTVAHEKIEARLLKAMALRKLGKPQAAAEQMEQARSDWARVSENAANFEMNNGLVWCRLVFIRSMLGD